MAGCATPVLGVLYGSQGRRCVQPSRCSRDLTPSICLAWGGYSLLVSAGKCTSAGSSCHAAFSLATGWHTMVCTHLQAGWLRVAVHDVLSTCRVRLEMRDPLCLRMRSRRPSTRPSQSCRPWCLPSFCRTPQTPPHRPPQTPWTAPQLIKALQRLRHPRRQR